MSNDNNQIIITNYENYFLSVSKLLRLLANKCLRKFCDEFE